MHTLRSLFLHEIGEMLDCENQLGDLFQKMQRPIEHSPLVRIVEVQILVVTRQIERLHLVVDSFHATVKAGNSTFPAGLIDRDVTGGPSDPVIRSVLARVDHYKLATYRCLRDWAALLGNDLAAAYLEENHADSRAANATLCSICRAQHIPIQEAISAHETILTPFARLLSPREREVLHWLVEGMSRRAPAKSKAANTPLNLNQTTDPLPQPQVPVRAAMPLDM